MDEALSLLCKSSILLFTAMVFGWMTVCLLLDEDEEGI